jgi:Fe-S oxidoreductase
VGRAELLRDVIKRRRKVDDAMLEQLYYWQCLTCRRCGYVCPFGIDQAEVREGVPFEAGLVSRWASTTIDGFLETGNLMKITPVAVVNILTYFADKIARAWSLCFTSSRHYQKKMLKCQGKKPVREVPPGDPE